MPNFLSTPSRWLRTPRRQSSPIVDACAIERPLPHPIRELAELAAMLGVVAALVGAAVSIFA